MVQSLAHGAHQRGNVKMTGFKFGSVAVVQAVRIALCAAMLGTILPTPSTLARQSTPEAAPNPAPCTVPSRPPDEMRALLAAGLPEVAPIIAGTPAKAAATPARAAPTEGVPADATTTQAVTATIEQFVACTNAGDVAAVATLLTDRGAQGFLAFGFLTFRKLLPGGGGTPTATAGAALVDLYLGALQLHAPVPPSARLALHGIDSVRVLPDGRVRVIARVSTGSEAPRQIAILLRQERGSYRIVFGPDENGGSRVIPAP